MPLSRGTERLSFEAVALETPSITTVAALVKKAEDDPHGNRFITTVRPKNLPEWGIKFEEISPPGCAIDFHLIQEELRPGQKKKEQQQRCIPVPKY